MARSGAVGGDPVVPIKYHTTSERRTREHAKKGQGRVSEGERERDEEEEEEEEKEEEEEQGGRKHTMFGSVGGGHGRGGGVGGG